MASHTVVRQHSGRTTPGVEDVLTFVGDPSGYTHVDVVNRDGAGTLLVTTSGNTPSASDPDTLTVAASPGADGTLGIPEGQTTAEIRVLSTEAVAYSAYTVDVRSWPERPRSLYPAKPLLTPEWDDVEIPFNGMKEVPALDTPPTWTVVAGIALPTFPAGSVSGLSFEKQLPHSYAEGTDILPHVHWYFLEGSPSGSIIWGADFFWTNVGDVGGTLVQITGTKTPTVDEVAEHLVTPLNSGPTDGTGKNLSSVIRGRFYRDGVTDDFNGAAYGFSFDFHTKRNSVGSPLQFHK